MRVTYDPISRRFKSVTGAVSDSEQLNINIEISGVESCCLVLTSDDGGENTTYAGEKSGDRFGFTLPPLKRGLYFIGSMPTGVKSEKTFSASARKESIPTIFSCLFTKAERKPRAVFTAGLCIRFSRTDSQERKDSATPTEKD